MRNLFNADLLRLLDQAVGTEPCFLDEEPERWQPISDTDPEVEIAKAGCAECSLRQQCLAYALAHPEETGIWGGLTETERAELRSAA